MTRDGYFLASEEHEPAELVRQAKLAEEAGFESLWISDHFHPWLDEQGQSGFVWSVIGAISQVTSLPVTTAVTCPLRRIHPALVAQAAATSALLTGGRFTLGVGTGARSRSTPPTGIPPSGSSTPPRAGARTRESRRWATRPMTTPARSIRRWCSTTW
jgi:alkanesulfonate monooxygenase SsuD/methylene tetrahydromethanopterin reductase-like flavin-dependent oxidoreductase (luciferase family)